MKKNDVSNAIKALKAGNLIVYPTDTLYAIGADIFCNDAVKKVFDLKIRPYSNPLPVAVANFDEIKKIAYTDDVVEKLVDLFLPGPLTIILRKKEIVSDVVVKVTSISALVPSIAKICPDDRDKEYAVLDNKFPELDTFTLTDTLVPAGVSAS